MNNNFYNFQSAVEDFQNARQRASIQEVVARVTGRSNQLLSYDDVAKKLRLQQRTERGIHNIPLDAIVGSVGRYTDFTRTFLPLQDSDRERWVSVKAAMRGDAGLPAIEVYKVGEVYFVLDGNHRVSIARQEGLKSIEAHVVEFKTDVTLTSDTNLDDLIVKAEYVEFIEKTDLANARPNVDLSVTIPGQYEKLLEQIDVCKYIDEDEKKMSISLQAAAADWYDTLYIPLAEAIRDRELLQWFPGRTITDLYIWISENRAALEKELGWELRSDAAATDLILKRSIASESGSWRKARTIARYTDHLFEDILIPLSGQEESWDALYQGIVIAKRENARLHGLHIARTREEADSSEAQEVKERFEKVCKNAGIHGSLAIDVGDITQRIIERAIVTDLVVAKLVNPPGSGLSVLNSPFRAMIEKSSRPLLMVPRGATPFTRALLAFDGSELAKEALFVTAYLAEIWKTEVTVFTARHDGNLKEDVQDYARRYFELHEVEAKYIISTQKSPRHLPDIAAEYNADLILMGSHSGNKLQQVLMGSMVDVTLRESSIPTLVCR
ncbi:MAG TPA: universal stress protein [Anaerolineales bacterium]|nr:universal stress protein [Anaerolineales bacterium]HNC07264.1 universal stress protein [Anaerolineales bacterium]